VWVWVCHVRELEGWGEAGLEGAVQHLRDEVSQSERRRWPTVSNLTPGGLCCAVLCCVGGADGGVAVWGLRRGRRRPEGAGARAAARAGLWRALGPLHRALGHLPCS
jgi:hypothetical protein